MEEAMKAMASVNIEDVTHDFRPFLVIYKDGHVQRFLGTQTVPPSKDSITGVESQDVVIRPKEEDGGLWVRLYKPSKKDDDKQRFPVVVYYHGGGFCVESAASPAYHAFLNALSCKANVMVVSVDYRLAPEHPLPAAYDDSWAGLQWVLQSPRHPWIKDDADLSKVYVAGDSAGGNIAHQMAKKLGLENKMSMNMNMNKVLKGVLLIHPYFWGKERIGSEVEKLAVPPWSGMADRLWEFVCPGTSGTDDPLINPGMDTELAVLAAEKVMVCVAEEDSLRDRGVVYKEDLIKSGCKASVELVETIGENHVFHLFNPSSPNVGPFVDQIAGFLKSS
ncbi:putative carboxylesterase 2 [Bienertia sinuspersici]